MPCCSASLSRVTCGVLAAVIWCATAVDSLAAEPVQLTRDRRMKASPVFVREGREIIYVELATPMLFRLTRLKLDDGSSEPFHPQATTSEFEPAVSADGKVCAFLRTVGVLKINMDIEEFGGPKLGEVPSSAGFSGLRSPAVSPDHRVVLYSIGEGGRQQLFQVLTNGMEKKALTDSRGINNWPAFSPDGRSIVFGSSREGDFEIYRMPAEGGEPVRLTTSPSQDIRPKFSPDGKRIAFTSHRDGNAEIYVMNSDGTEPRRITQSEDRDDYADWHPDGKRLVIVTDKNGSHDLFLVTVD